MKVFLSIACVLACSVASAQTFVPAQQAAEAMARRGVLAHAGNSGGRPEGIAFSPVSAGHAISTTCFWGQRKPREIGVARGARGWFACVRYH